MKKILISVRDLNIGGVQKSLIELLKLFDTEIEKDQIQVDLLCLNSNCTLKNQINHNIRIINPNNRFDIFGLSKVESKRNLALFLRRTFWAIWSKIFSNKLPLKKALRKQSFLGSYDLAISYAITIDKHSLYAGWSELVLDKCEAKKKIVYIHNDYINSAINNKNTYELLKQFDKIWFVSKSCENAFLCKYQAFKGKTDYLYNCLDIQRINKLSVEQCDLKRRDCLNIVSVSRLSPEKAHIRTLHILKQLKEEGYKFFWHIIGDGPEKDKIKRTITQLDIGDCVEMYGAKENPYPYIKQSDLLMLNSINESFGIVLIESMLLNTPIFTTNTVSAMEIVGENGIVCDNNSNAIYIALKQLIDKPQLIEKYKQKLANYSYDNNKIKEKFVRLINE